MRGEDIVMFCWPDLAVLAHGRSFPACTLEERPVKGICEKLPTPPVLERMPVDRSEAAREALGIRRLPGSLDEALELMVADDLVRSWFSPNLFDAYISLKRTEMRILEGLSPSEQCERYRNVY